MLYFIRHDKFQNSITYHFSVLIQPDEHIIERISRIYIFPRTVSGCYIIHYFKWHITAFPHAFFVERDLLP